MFKENLEYLKACDPEIGAAVELERDRQSYGIELIASENITSVNIRAQRLQLSYQRPQP